MNPPLTAFRSSTRDPIYQRHDQPHRCQSDGSQARFYHHACYKQMVIAGLFGQPPLGNGERWDELPAHYRLHLRSAAAHLCSGVVEADIRRTPRRLDA
jgi:hypothetical protein